MQVAHDFVTRRQLAAACGLTAAVTFFAGQIGQPRAIEQKQAQIVTIESNPVRQELADKAFKELVDGLRSGSGNSGFNRQ